jgi:hypothetical protein
MKSTLFLSAIALFSAVACGPDSDASPEFDRYSDAELQTEGDAFDDEALALGTLEQGYNAPVTLNTQFGTQTGSSRQKCNRTSSGQVCSFLRTRQPNICLETFGPNGFSAQDAVYAQTGAIRVDSGLSGYAFQWLPAIDTFGCVWGNEHIIIKAASVGQSGTGNSNAHNYSTSAFSDINQLTENPLPGEAPVVGSYQSHGECVAYVDVFDLKAKGTTAAEDQRLIENAAAWAVAGCLGVGGSSQISSSTRITKSLLNGNLTNTVFSAGEQCQANAFANTSNGNWFNAGNCGND